MDDGHVNNQYIHGHANASSVDVELTIDIDLRYVGHVITIQRCYRPMS